MRYSFEAWQLFNYYIFMIIKQLQFLINAKLNNQRINIFNWIIYVI